MRADWLLFTDRTLPSAVSDFSGTHEERAALAAAGGPVATKSDEADVEAAAAQTDEHLETLAEVKPKRRIRRSKATAEAESAESGTETEVTAEADTGAEPKASGDTGDEEADADA